MKSRQDVWSKSKEFARHVAAGANKSGKPIHEIDKVNGKPKRILLADTKWQMHFY
ncbi:hypothetical protein Q5M85_10380 [Paraclostridium bifermentans]|nr:hypothetical protein [Paraclostridium bifermentans]